MSRPRRRISLATYNIHKCVGRDGIHCPERIYAVLRELDADIVGVQEFDSRPRPNRRPITVDDFVARTGYRVIAQPTMAGGGGFHGNLLLSRVALTNVRKIDLTMRGFEPRGAILADLDDGRLRVAVTHLGLWPGARRRQAARLLGALTPLDATPVAVAGDFNEWLPVGGCLGILSRHFHCHRTAATFPAHRPRARIDRVWARPRDRLVETVVHATALACQASDHLPVRAVFGV